MGRKYIGLALIIAATAAQAQVATRRASIVGNRGGGEDKSPSRFGSTSRPRLKLPAIWVESGPFQASRRLGSF